MFFETDALIPHQWIVETSIKKNHTARVLPLRNLIPVLHLHTRLLRAWPGGGDRRLPAQLPGGNGPTDCWRGQNGRDPCFHLLLWEKVALSGVSGTLLHALAGMQSSSSREPNLSLTSYTARGTSKALICLLKPQETAPFPSLHEALEWPPHLCRHAAPGPSQAAWLRVSHLCCRCVLCWEALPFALGLVNSSLSTDLAACVPFPRFPAEEKPRVGVSWSH